MSAKLSSPLPLAKPTSAEQEKAVAYLVSTRDDLFQATHGLSPKQWVFTSNPSEWCIAGIVEHLALVEGRVHAIIARLPEASLADPQLVQAEVEERIVTAIASRTGKVTAPPQSVPTGKCSPSESLRAFGENRSETLRLLGSALCLRGRVIPHPIMGPWDGYQWILSTGAHTVRHTKQIMELKLHASFPATE